MKKEGFALLGAWGQGNLGDQAILEGMLQALEGETVRVLSRGRVQVPALLWRQPHRVVAALAKSRVLLLGGGTLLQDQTSRRSLWFYVGLSALAKALGCRVMVFAGGLGPFRCPSSRRITRYFLDRVCDEITLRTPADGETLRALGVKRGFTVTSDGAFLAPFWALQMQGTGPLDAGKWVFCPHFGQPIPPEILENPGLWTVLPLGKKDEKTLVPGAQMRSAATPEEAWRLLQGAQKVCSQRLHGMILSYGKPVKAASKDPKIQGFLPEMEYSLNYHREKAMENIQIAKKLNQ